MLFWIRIFIFLKCKSRNRRNYKAKIFFCGQEAGELTGLVGVSILIVSFFERCQSARIIVLKGKLVEAALNRVNCFVVA